MRTIYVNKSTETEEPVCVLEQNVMLPEMADNSILVQIKACGLSTVNFEIFQELNIRREKYPLGREISGSVTEVGSAVTSIKVGDDVVGVLPLDTECSGCADLCIINDYDVIVKPSRVTFREAVACIGDGIRAYTALQYLAKISAGDTVLVMDSANSQGSTLIQLAQLWGAKVIATAATQEEKMYLERFKPELAHVIDLIGGKKDALLNSCLEETGGLGVDVIIDNGVCMYSADEDESITGSPAKTKRDKHLPSKHEIISSLSIGGRWVTSQYNLQLDPPDSQLLFFKGASVSFLFDSFWTLSSGQQGRYQHILKDIINKVANGTLRPNISETLSLDKVPDVYRRLTYRTIGKFIMETDYQ